MFVRLLVNFKKILTFTLGAPSERNGMGGAMVVAAETGEATTIMLPLGQMAWLGLDIMNRTKGGTTATTKAAVGVDTERGIGDEPLHKHRADKPAVDAGPATNVEGRGDGAMLHNVGNDALQTLLRSRNLLFLTLWGVDIHKRHAHIRFGHKQ